MIEIIMVICMTSFGEIKGKVVDFGAGGVYNKSNSAIEYWLIEESGTKDTYKINSNSCLRSK